MKNRDAGFLAKSGLKLKGSWFWVATFPVAFKLSFVFSPDSSVNPF